MWNRLDTIKYPREVRDAYPGWSKRDRVREMIRIRDSHTCQVCWYIWKKEMRHRRFDVHHIDSLKKKTLRCDNLEKEKDNLITLCHKCHFNVHAIQNKRWFLLTLNEIKKIK
jgi:5-methylcytosine-specific restriction endonuclease McrA